MAINKNHEFEDLNGIKCAVVEKNITKSRVEFLQKILEHNGYTVIVVAATPAKTAAPPEGEQPEPVPELYTIGVTDVMFNATNAVFGRSLRSAEGGVVTLAYWRQQELKADDSVPYFEKSF